MKIVILAAGHGKRMGGELPKVLVPLAGKSLIVHLLDAVKEAGVADTPVIVVGQKREMVIEALGPQYSYAIQEEQLGTGHAVLCAQSALEDAEDIMVLYGDHPLLSHSTIKKLAETHLSSGAALTMATTTIEDFSEWRAGFLNFGRIVRDDAGKIIKIVEKKDATEDELNIYEVNPAYFCFKAAWLWPHLKALSNKNMQGEYYLTDLVHMAMNEGISIAEVRIDPLEALGANTAAELSLISKTLEEIHKAS